MKKTGALDDSIVLINKFANEAMLAIKEEQNDKLIDIMKAMCDRTF